MKRIKGRVDHGVHHGIEQYAGIEKTALTLGKFDGLHKGHQKLIDKICAYSGENCKSVLCAFDMHRESLMTKQERRSHLEGKSIV